MQFNKRHKRSGNAPRKPRFLGRSLESAGPDVKVRGSAAQIAEKYQNLARDAQVSGDQVVAENYLQHAEHYVRLVNNLTSEQRPGRSVTKDGSKTEGQRAERRDQVRDAHENNDEETVESRADLDVGQDEAPGGPNGHFRENEVPARPSRRSTRGRYDRDVRLNRGEERFLFDTAPQDHSRGFKLNDVTGDAIDRGRVGAGKGARTKSGSAPATDGDEEHSADIPHFMASRPLQRKNSDAGESEPTQSKPRRTRVTERSRRASSRELEPKGESKTSAS